jgi:hypothetical protein
MAGGEGLPGLDGGHRLPGGADQRGAVLHDPADYRCDEAAFQPHPLAHRHPPAAGGRAPAAGRHYDRYGVGADTLLFFFLLCSALLFV